MSGKVSPFHKKHNDCVHDQLFCGLWYLRGRNPIGWPHTIQLGEPNCRGMEALPHQYNTPHTQYQGVPSTRTKNSR
jgi:hypothetical protein